jgi:ankyrin repeat protein
MREINIEKAFIKAISCGHLAIVINLLNQLSKVRDIDIQGYNILTFAISKGQVNVVKYFLKKYKDLVDKCDNNGNNPLIVASSNNYPEIVSLLFENLPSNLENTNKDNLNIALNIASQKGFLIIVYLLLNKGAKTNIVDNRGNIFNEAMKNVGWKIYKSFKDGEQHIFLTLGDFISYMQVIGFVAKRYINNIAF